MLLFARRRLEESAHVERDPALLLESRRQQDIRRRARSVDLGRRCFGRLLLFGGRVGDEAVLDGVGEEGAVEIASDEDDFGDARLVGPPGRLRGAEVDLLVDALEDELGVALAGEREDALGPVEVGRARLQELGHEHVELGHVEHALDRDAARRDHREVVDLFGLFGRLLAVLAGAIVLFGGVAVGRVAEQVGVEVDAAVDVERVDADDL
mmetsp:Transcript_23057/g.91437  ORF Transcript_23057/g.91437 Transcript_23057/m.91437 type:complete len:210 (+) Transcript_23057:220-849(+)